MPLIDFRLTVKQALTIVEDAIQYAVAITQNLLYETDLNSPFRLLVEAQTYIYNQFIIILGEVENTMTLKFLEIMGFTPELSSFARVKLRFELLTSVPPSQNNYIRKGFPVRATNGLIFTTDSVLLIPSNTTVGYVWATATRAGNFGNVAANTVTQPLQTINYSLGVTNPEKAVSGTDGETINDAMFRLGASIRKNGLITVDNYQAFVKELIPNAIVNVGSLQPNTVSVWVSTESGSLLSPNQMTQLTNKLNENRILGLEEIVVNDIITINVYVEVIAMISFPSQAERAAIEVRDLIFSFLVPSNNRQVQGNTAGIIIINDLERIINAARIDYISTVKIGTTPDTSFTQNFTFDPLSNRVYCSQLRVVLIKDSFQLIKDFVQ